jgi:hypothetical protein
MPNCWWKWHTVAWSCGRDDAPSNTVRSQSTSRTSHLLPPPMLAEALARAQLLLDFPPAPEKMEEWRSTIQSLIGFINKDGPQPTGPRGSGLLIRCEPMVRRLEAVRPRCTPLHDSSSGRQPSGLTVVMMIP